MNKHIHLLLLVAAFTTLMIHMGLMVQVALYADEYGTSPVTVFGGEFWNLMDWAMLLLHGLIFLLLAATYASSMAKK